MTISRLRTRLSLAGNEGGFSLVELMIVLVMITILLSISVGVYLRMRDKGEQSTAASNVREALPAVELYFAHHDTYTGMTRAELKLLDAGVLLSEEPVISADGKSYCVESTHNGHSASSPGTPGHNPHSLTGPGGNIVAGPCPASL